MLSQPAFPKAAVPRRLLLIAALSVVAACSDGSSGFPPATADSPVGLEASDSSVAVVNRTGTSLVKGQVEIVATGSMRPLSLLLARLSNGEKRTLRLEEFRTPDGTPFRRGVHRARYATVVATDLNGKEYKFEAPFK